MIGKVDDKPGKKKSEEKNISNNSGVGKNITQDEISTQFEVFLDKIRKDQPRLFSAMKNQSVVLNSQSEIEVYFQNNAQLEEFKQRLKPTLISHFRGALGIDECVVLEKVVDAEKLVRPKLYSDGERFKQLSDKNPALVKLKNLFGLDFE